MIDLFKQNGDIRHKSFGDLMCSGFDDLKSEN